MENRETENVEAGKPENEIQNKGGLHFEKKKAGRVSSSEVYC